MGRHNGAKAKAKPKAKQPAGPAAKQKKKVEPASVSMQDQPQEVLMKAAWKL